MSDIQGGKKNAARQAHNRSCEERGGSQAARGAGCLGEGSALNLGPESSLCIECL